MDAHRTIDQKPTTIGRSPIRTFGRSQLVFGPTYAHGVNETARTERLDGGTALLLLSTVVALSVVDAVLGRTLLETTVPALVADAAVALAVLLARRSILAAMLVAAAASAAVSFAVSGILSPSFTNWALREHFISGSRIVGLGAWPGIGEFAGMAVLCAMAIRR